MSAFVRVSSILEKANGELFFDCPGYEMLHDVNVEIDDPPRRSWNSSVDKPTFHPLILCRHPQRLLKNGERGQVIYYPLVTDGRIQSLSDYTYHLAGQTVNLPQLEDDGRPGSATGNP